MDIHAPDAPDETTLFVHKYSDWDVLEVVGFANDVALVEKNTIGAAGFDPGFGNIRALRVLGDDDNLNFILVCFMEGLPSRQLSSAASPRSPHKKDSILAVIVFEGNRFSCVEVGQCEIRRTIANTKPDMFHCRRCHPKRVVFHLPAETEGLSESSERSIYDTLDGDNIRIADVNGNTNITFADSKPSAVINIFDLGSHGLAEGVKGYQGIPVFKPGFWYQRHHFVVDIEFQNTRHSSLLILTTGRTKANTQCD